MGRRLFLRGAGTVAIGLPLAASVERLGLAQAAPRPPRYVSLYFGNGLPKLYADAGLTGPLAPLAPFADKLAMLRGLQLPIGDGDPGAFHWQGTGRFGAGYTPPDVTSGAAETLDNALFEAQGQGTNLLVASMHGRADGNRATRWYHSWRGPRSPNTTILNPYDLFSEIFGAPDAPTTTRRLSERQILDNRRHNSVLDGVVDQYRHIMGERSGFSAGVRSLISDHLELVRTLEYRATRSGEIAQDATPRCMDTPPEPPPHIDPLQFCTADACDNDKPWLFGEDDTANWNEVWPLMSELYAVALRCGSTRFGTLGCTASGDRYPIPELADAGVTQSAHELAHNWRRDQENGFGLCTEWLMQKIALFLGHLDDPAWPDERGGTVLDNTLVLIGTELGTATDGQHHVDSMSYFLAGGGDFVRTGIHDFPGATDVDLLSSIARAMGLAEHFGDTAAFGNYLDVFRL
jgi:hypothetical protein